MNLPIPSPGVTNGLRYAAAYLSALSERDQATLARLLRKLDP